LNLIEGVVEGAGNGEARIQVGLARAIIADLMKEANPQDIEVRSTGSASFIKSEKNALFQHVNPYTARFRARKNS